MADIRDILDIEIVPSIKGLKDSILSISDRTKLKKNSPIVIFSKVTRNIVTKIYNSQLFLHFELHMLFQNIITNRWKLMKINFLFVRTVQRNDNCRIENM